jgi:hypothetical protein
VPAGLPPRPQQPAVHIGIVEVHIAPSPAPLPTPPAPTPARRHDTAAPLSRPLPFFGLAQG